MQTTVRFRLGLAGTVKRTTCAVRTDHQRRKAQIADGERQLQDAWNQYYAGKTQLEQAEQMLGQLSSQLAQIKQEYDSLVASGELKNPNKQLEFARRASAALTDFITLLQNNQGNTDIIAMLQSVKSEIDNRIQKADEEIAQGKPLSSLITDTETKN